MTAPDPGGRPHYNGILRRRERGYNSAGGVSVPERDHRRGRDCDPRHRRDRHPALGPDPRLHGVHRGDGGPGAATLRIGPANTAGVFQHAVRDGYLQRAPSTRSGSRRAGTSGSRAPRVSPSRSRSLLTCRRDSARTSGVSRSSSQRGSYEVIVAACSSPQTTEMNAKTQRDADAVGERRRGEAAFFVVVAACIDQKYAARSWPGGSSRRSSCTCSISTRTRRVCGRRAGY